MKGRDLFEWLRVLAVQEGAVSISPHPDPFREYQRTFLEGLRRIPASIVAPPGVNPYGMASGKEGTWLLLWIPEDD